MTYQKRTNILSKNPIQSYNVNVETPINKCVHQIPFKIYNTYYTYRDSKIP